MKFYKIISSMLSFRAQLRQNAQVRPLVLMFILFLLSSNCMLLSQDEKAFLQGNQLFEQGNYDQACQAYQVIEHKTCSVLFNMGLSYLNQGKKAQAVLEMKRAEKQATFEQLTKIYEIFHWIRQQDTPDYALGWQGQLAIFLKKCILSISTLLLQLLLFLILIVLICCWYSRLYKHNKNIFFWIILLSVLMASTWAYKIHLMQQKSGIVMQKVIPVFAGPDMSFDKKSELHEADEVTIMVVHKGYYQVKAQQVVGWIHAHDVELV